MDLVGIKCGVLADRVAALIELEDRPLDMAAATLREQTNPHMPCDGPMKQGGRLQGGPDGWPKCPRTYKIEPLN